jgi:hypothetical protein
MKTRLSSKCDTCVLRDVKCNGAIDANGDCARKLKNLLRRLVGAIDEGVFRVPLNSTFMIDAACLLNEIRAAIGEDKK